MEAEGSLPCSQKPANDPCPEPGERERERERECRVCIQKFPD